MYFCTVSDEPPPGSASAVSRNLLKSIATQFADRRFFLFLFKHDFGKKKVERVFSALAASLSDLTSVPEEAESGDTEERGLTVVSPVIYFLQVRTFYLSVTKVNYTLI